MNSVLLLLLGATAIPGAGYEGLTRFEYFRMQMGTRVRIVLHAADEEAAREAAAAAFDRIAELDGLLSDYNPESELMQLCRTGYPTAVPVSPDLYVVLQRALGYSRDTSGAFDVTVGPLVALWRDARKTGRLPSSDRLRHARGSVGFNKIVLGKGTAALRRPGMRLDLGGIAKGYAADAALALLKARGLERAMVDAGGDIRVGAPPPGRPGWVIEIQNTEGSGGRAARLSLSDCAVATSGDTEQYLEVDGIRYSHIVDPRTGLGVRKSARVTVIGRDCTEADALATALSILEPEEGVRVAHRKGAAARITVREGTLLRTVDSEGLSRYLRDRDLPAGDARAMSGRQGSSAPSPARF